MSRIYLVSSWLQSSFYGNLDLIYYSHVLFFLPPQLLLPRCDCLKAINDFTLFFLQPCVNSIFPYYRMTSHLKMVEGFPPWPEIPELYLARTCTETFDWLQLVSLRLFFIRGFQYFIEHQSLLDLDNREQMAF